MEKRYACTVCFHRPVFDTLDMLTVHRSGKKHLMSLQKFYGKKRSLEKEVEKRQHQEYLEAEGSATQATPGPAPLLAATRKITQNALLKAVPYNSCCRRNREAGVVPGTSRMSASSQPTERDAMLKAKNAVPAKGDNEPAGLETTQTVHLPGSGTKKTDSPKDPPLRKEGSPEEKASSLGRSSPKSMDLTPEKRHALEHYLKLKSSGWIQDCSGKWVKDENAEFDSDEEEPPPLNPL